MNGVGSSKSAALPGHGPVVGILQVELRLQLVDERVALLLLPGPVSLSGLAAGRGLVAARGTLLAGPVLILARVTEGQTNREIGNALYQSERTVRNYVSSILSKLNLTSRAQAAAYAARHRIEDYI